MPQRFAGGTTEVVPPTTPRGMPRSFGVKERSGTGSVQPKAGWAEGPNAVETPSV